MMQYDVIENNGVLAPSRREAIIDPMVGANHNNKPTHGKTFFFLNKKKTPQKGEIGGYATAKMQQFLTLNMYRFSPAVGPL